MIGADAVRLAQERFGLECPPEGPLVPRERLVELARALYDELGYVYLSYITAVHHPEETKSPATEHGHAAAKSAHAVAATAGAAAGSVGASPETGTKTETAAAEAVAAEPGPEPAPPEVVPAYYVVVYRVRNLAQNTEFPFRCRVPVGTSVPTLAFVWVGADWQEREAFDLVGPVFEGHPDLRRIMLPEDWEGHPLQRQYAIDTPHRPWR